MTFCILRQEAKARYVKTDKSIDEIQTYDKLNFDPDGETEIMTALKSLDILYVMRCEKEAHNETEKILKKNGRNDISDAFRHAHFNYRLAKTVGLKRAKAYSDALKKGLLRTKIYSIKQ